MRALLDIDVLLALFDEAQVHHATARDWLIAHRADGWAIPLAAVPRARKADLVVL